MSDNKPAPPSPPPSVSVIFGMYVVLGTAPSFLAGEDPGSLPDADEKMVRAMGPSIGVIAMFLIGYSVLDVMAVGLSKVEYGYMTRGDYKDLPHRLPEKVFLAERAQMNQLEQMPLFIFGTLSFSLLVNARVGAILALVWAILRILYARTYRRSVGVPFHKKGLATYTIPCYFIVNTMLMGSVVHALRWAVA